MSYQFLWPFAAGLSIISPLGIFVSSKIISNLGENWLTSETINIVVLITFLAFICLIIYDPNQGIINVIYSDVLISFTFAHSTFLFIRLRQDFIQLKKVIDPFIVGLSLIVLGLWINVVYLLIFQVSHILFRFVFPILGLCLLAYSLIKSNSKDLTISFLNQEFREKYFPFKEKFFEVSSHLHSYLLEPSQLNQKLRVNLETNLYADLKKLIDNKLDGLSLSILLEIASQTPKPITNKYLQDIFNRRKQSISFRLKKLVHLKLIVPVIDLDDIRNKPYKLSQEGISFLINLNSFLSNYLSEF